MYDMSARNFFRNAAVGMKCGFFRGSLKQSLESCLTPAFIGGTS
jgi:hypothetical protein